MALLTAAAGMGARSSRSTSHWTRDSGNDHYHSMDVSNLKVLRSNIEFVSKALGSEMKAPLASEEPARMYARRSIVTTQAISKGTVIGREMLDFKRPGTGIPPGKLGDILGKRVKRDIDKDTQIKMNDIESG